MKRPLLTILYFAAVLSWLTWLDPDLNPSYNTEIRVAQPLDMGPDNAAIALLGLNAPEGTEDSYKYGRMKASRWLETYELIKKEHKIDPVYCTPAPDAIALINPPEKKPEIKLKESMVDMRQMECLSGVPERTREISPCATQDDLQQWISANAVMWGRYNDLLTHKKFVPVPENFEEPLYSGADLLTLSKMKAVDILANADKDPGYVFQQWYQSMRLARQMVGSHTLITEKPIFMAMLGQQITTLEALLYKYPKMAARYQSAIEEMLKPGGVALYNAGTMFADDWRLAEPTIYQTMQTSIHGETLNPVERFISRHIKLVSNGFLNDVYDCAKKSSALATMSADDYAAYGGKPFCADIFDDDPLIQGLKMPGNFVTNVALYILVDGMPRGEMLVQTMHLQDARMRMGILGTRILVEKIPAAKIQDYLDAAPPELQSPFKASPFLWDKTNERIFFKPPETMGLDQSFYLRIGKKHNLYR